MIKKLFTLLCLCVLCIGSAWGADKTYSFTPDATTTGSSATAYVTSAYSFTYNEIGWSFNQWNPSTLQIKTNQSSAGSEFNFKNTSAFPGKIKSVVITFNALTVSSESGLCFVGGSSAISSLSGGSAGTWNSTAKTLTWIPADGTNYTYFAFYQNGKVATGTNKLASSDAIVVTYESTTPTGPSITCADITNVPCEGVIGATTTVTFNNAEGWTPSVTCDNSIVTAASISGTTLTYSVAANSLSATREGNIYLKLSKDGEKDIEKNVKVSQKAYVKEYADLPFEWKGGTSAEFTALDGVTANGLGSDYSSDNAPYRIKLDGTGDYIQVKTNEPIGVLTIDVKMLGGSNSSSIAVKGSADGSNFTDVETLAISGSQNTVLNLETANDLDESYRYVRLVFTKGSNVGVGPITIAKAVVVDYWVVKYDANGGTGAPADDQVTKGESTTISTTAPTRDGYDFAGWTLTKDGDDVVSGTYTPSANVTLYAKWTAKDIDLTATAPDGGTYTVKIGDAEAVTISSEQVLSAKAGTTIVMTTTAAEGYKVSSTPFKVNDGDVKVSKSDDNYSFEMPGIATTIVANYSKLYTISVASCTNGAITKIADKDGYEISEASKNSKIVVTATPDAMYKVSKLYYIEEGSSDKSEFTADGFFTMPGNNVTVYAEFEETPDIIFDFTSGNPGGWPTSTTNEGSYTYNLGGNNYTFNLKNVQYNESMKTLYPQAGGSVGLPAIEGMKLTKIVANNRSTCNLDTKVSITTTNDGTSVVAGGSVQTWSTQSSSYTYNLTGTEANTVYYLYANNKNPQIDCLTLTYEPVLKTQDVTIAVGGYSSFSATCDMAVPEDVEAWYATACNNSSVSMTKIEDGKIPANTGVILKGTAGEKYTLTETVGATTIEGNLLVAFAENQAAKSFTAGDGWYYLSTEGCFKDLVNDSFVLKAGKAYLYYKASNAKELTLEFGEPTGINNVSNTNIEGAIYNLNGIRVNSMVKGNVYIVNGKKYLNK